MADQKIRKNANDFIVYKKSLGYVYNSSEKLLNRYVSYAENAVADIQYPTKEVIDEYFSEISGAEGTLYGSVAVLREFSRFLRARGYKDAYIIPKKAVPLPVPEEPSLSPESGPVPEGYGRSGG